MPDKKDFRLPAPKETSLERDKLSVQKWEQRCFTYIFSKERPSKRTVQPRKGMVDGASSGRALVHKVLLEANKYTAATKDVYTSEIDIACKSRSDSLSDLSPQGISLDNMLRKHLRTILAVHISSVQNMHILHSPTLLSVILAVNSQDLSMHLALHPHQLCLSIWAATRCGGQARYMG